LAALNPHFPTLIARPVLPSNNRFTHSEYFLSNVNPISLPLGLERKMRISNLDKPMIFGPTEFHPLHPMLPIFKTQQFVLGESGKVSRVSQLAGLVNLHLSTLSRKFRDDTGITLKAFLNKVRLCRCLMELICTRKPIKQVAIEFAYKPVSFSLKFHKTFGAWPSEARVARDMRLLDLFSSACFSERKNG
jgi:AraC-like DNA-binding protein